MGLLSALELQAFLELVNVVLASCVVIFSCALILYILVYNFRNHVARSFSGLLGCVMLTYFADLALFGVQDARVAESWLRFQWVGIAFIPAVYLDFSNALLITTGARSRLRDVSVLVSYLISACLLLGAAFGDFVVYGGVLTHGAPHLLPGRIFPFFVLYFFAAAGWGAANVLWARRRCLTSTSRRRMAYLTVTFAAPAAGVFPYLLLAGWPSYAPSLALWSLLVLGNVAVGLMLLILAYSVTFFGALTPDRVVKRRLARFLLRGPFLAMLLVIVVVGMSQASGWLGLPNNRLMLFGVVGLVLLMQFVIELTKPLLDRALYRQDHAEIAWLQQLNNRLLTTTDLRQFLENVLTALCDLLRVETAFVAVIDDGKPHLEVVCGSLEQEAADQLLPEAWRVSNVAKNGESPDGRRLERHGDLFVWDGYWLAPLRTKGQDDIVGVVGVAARAPEPDLTPEEEAGMKALLAQSAAALEDRQLQQGIFGALEQIIPEIEDIQRRRGVVHYVGEQALSGFDVVEAPDFRQWVRDALNHYWGGPKLTTSPLLALNVVARAVGEHEGNVAKGLRAVLEQAIERQRPDGKQQMTAPEWILYNILDLKFLQGRRVREIARRLAMSESDLYRKQRVAIEAVARTLAEMEREELMNAQEAGLRRV
jgi:hypothetical protein